MAQFCVNNWGGTTFRRGAGNFEEDTSYYIPPFLVWGGPSPLPPPREWRLCIYIYMRMHVCMYICTYVCMNACMYVLCIYVCMYM